ncbi:LysR family transcriptional regulator [Pseudomonas taeanensis MS-3]|uniref:LysR family transcriptional regulator n=1 Tax=Pseudomonas taeanensis MS-3 TaxID=1395571 RepID=A0A0A1YP91_9PSED|nr:LysR family transcriptional regulator [Pseudomonas taeanensis]KFX71752.1 LysR family transcriptional regulator [Pseudomonas taeanensis MS-3]
MRYHGLDLNLLALLEALRIEQNVTRAALRLNLTQSAVSAALGRLREHFGDPLFALVGGRMMPTALMQAMAPRLEEFLAVSRVLAFANASFDPAAASRRFYVTASDYVLAVVMPEVQRRLLDVAPGIRLSLNTLPFHSGQADRLAAVALEHNNSDFVILPDIHRSQAHPCAPFFQDGFTTIAWLDNSLIAGELTLAQYLELEHVVREISPGVPGSMEAEFFIQAGFERRVAVAVDQFGLIPEFVVGSSRVATLHSRLAVLYARRFPLRLIKPPLDLPATVQVIQWHAYQDADPAVTWLRQLMQDVAAVI